MSNNFNPHILVADSNNCDLTSIINILNYDFDGTVDFVSSGENVLLYLGKEGIYKNVTIPNLIILELNLTGINGKEILFNLKCDELLRKIPVIIFTNSSEKQDIIECYNLGANCYIVKPNDQEEFLDIVKIIKKHWIDNTTLPQFCTAHHNV